MVKTVEEMFAAFESQGWDWNEFHVYRHPRETRKYAVVIDSGCSCDGFTQPSLAMLEAETPIGKREVYKAFTEWFGRGDFMEGTKIDNMERLRSSL